MLEPAERGALCIFEFFYLARPDTRLAGVEVHGARVRMGERLAEEAPVEADLVLPIPDSGTPAAIGFSRATGIPFSEGLIKNRYVGRTFIQPDQSLRDQGVRMKFNPLAEVAGKRLVVVDDSIVRGSTTRQIVQMLFDSGAAEVHVRVSSPPIVSPCFYGIDLASEDEMIAAHATVDEVRDAIGATSLAYLSLDGLQAATRRPESALCRACLTREYPTRVPTDAAQAPASSRRATLGARRGPRAAAAPAASTKQAASRASSAGDPAVSAGAAVTRMPVPRNARRNSAVARALCQRDVTTTTSSTPSSSATARTCAAFSAVLSAASSTSTVVAGPGQASRIASASGRPSERRRPPVSTTASPSRASCAACSIRARQIGCSSRPRRDE